VIFDRRGAAVFPSIPSCRRPHRPLFVSAEDVMEMDIDDYFLERLLGFIDEEQAVHNPAGEGFFQWYQVLRREDFNRRS